MVGNPDKRRGGEQREILTQALAAFAETTATAATVIKTEIHLPQGVADAEICLTDSKKFLVEVRRTVTPATLGQAIAQLGRFKKPGILVTSYITPQMAERLKMLDVQFLDTVGNAYVHTPKLLIYVTGRKPNTPTAQEKRVRALRPTGLKVIFAMLCRPELINATYRDIAQTAGVALGTVNWVIDDLRRLGYIRQTKAQGRVFENRDGLLNKWVEAYTRELRPKLKSRRYRVVDADWWKKNDLVGFDMCLGGEPAAAVLTKHLRPERVTVYGDTQFATLARKIHAVKDEYGNLEVLQKFWAFEPRQLDKRYPLVPPLLVYADLVATADIRNIETAQIIRERFLAKD